MCPNRDKHTDQASVIGIHRLSRMFRGLGWGNRIVKATRNALDPLPPSLLSLLETGEYLCCHVRRCKIFSLADMPGSTASEGRAHRRETRPRRAKVFTGCLTCRSRHLKCDEARPTCRRCSDAQLTCAGYHGYRAGVRWVSVEGPANFRSGAPSLLEDGTRPMHETLVSFSETAVVPHSARTEADCLPSPAVDEAEAVLGVDLLLQDADNDPVQRCHNNTPTDVPSLSSHALPLTPHYPGAVENSLTIRRHLDLSPSTHLQLKAIEYWVSHLSDALSCVPGPLNPLKRIFMPIMYEGARCPGTQSNASIALFYLVCSAAAFHLSAHSTDDRERSDYLTFALSYQSDGVRHLNHSLMKDDVDDREGILASLLMCLTYEPATDQRGFWLTHLHGASLWLGKIDVRWWARKESTLIMYQMVASTAIFLRSQLLSHTIASESNFNFDMNEVMEPYHLDYIFGIPKRALRMITYMISLSVAMEQKGQQPQVDLDLFETELYLASPLECNVPPAIKDQEDLIRHYSHIFYLGSIVYCKRRLRDQPPASVQGLVEQVLEHIEALKGFTGRRYCPVLWPIAVALFEAQGSALRSRALVWVDMISEMSTLSMWQKFKILLGSFWDRRDTPGHGEMKWETYIGDPLVPSLMMV